MTPIDAVFYQDPQTGERRKYPVLSEAQIDAIAERAADKLGNMLVDRIAEKAVEKITAQAYQMVGKTVLDKLIWLTGVISIGLTLFAAGRGWIKMP